MPQTTHQPGVMFAVDEVTPATKPLPEQRTYEAVKCTLGGEIESCCDYHGTVIKRVNYQPLLAAVYTAFNEHRPLVLTPDAVWITIAQGIAHHMTIHGERLRSRFVAHQGQLELKVECFDWLEGSPENPWPEAFDSWAGQIREHVGSRVHDTLLCDFSTSGSLERTVSQIVMMDVFDRYFEYLLLGICGIPSITLEGTPDDWQHLLDKARGLDVFDLDWWLVHLIPLCEQFVRASRGDVDLAHWTAICKLRNQYGGDVINGWVARLFPYFRAFIDGPCNQRNPIFETGEGFQTLVAPTGLSRVPFVWRNGATGRERRMEAIGGLVGVTQDSQTLALRPKLGWAVREAEKIDVLLARLAAEHKTFPGARIEGHTYLPADLAAFYHQTDGAKLFGRGDAVACRIVAVDDIEPLDWGEVPERFGNSRGPDGRIWHRFAWLADGSWLAINLDPNYRTPRSQDDHSWSVDRRSRPICRGNRDSRGRPAQNPVIALSFTELLESLMDKERPPGWLNPQSADYGDAEEYTRRT